MLNTRWIALSSFIAAFLAATPVAAQEAAKPEEKKAPWAETRRVSELLRDLNDTDVKEKDKDVVKTKGYKSEKAERDRQETILEKAKENFSVPVDERGANITAEARKAESVKHVAEQVNPRWLKERDLDKMLEKLAEGKNSVVSNLARTLLEQRAAGVVKSGTPILEEKAYEPLARLNDQVVDLLGGVKSPFAERAKPVEGFLNSCPTPEAARELLAALLERNIAVAKAKSPETRFQVEVARISKRITELKLTVDRLALLDKRTPEQQAEFDSALQRLGEHNAHLEDNKKWAAEEAEENKKAEAFLAKHRPVTAEYAALIAALEKCEQVEANLGELAEIEILLNGGIHSDAVRKTVDETVVAFKDLDASYKNGKAALEPKAATEAK